MTKSLIDKRTSRLPWYHASVALTLIVTASIGLCFSLLALLQPIRDCPVLNAHFVLYWFFASVEIVQLLIGGALLVLLFVFTCRRHIPRHSPLTNQLMGAVGSTGRLFVFRSNCTGLSPNRHVVNEEAAVSSPCYRPKTGLNRCCRQQKRCLGRIGWLQPVLLATGVVLIGHIVALVWASSTHRQMTNPHDTFESQLTGLFVEAKIQAGARLIGKTYSLTSAQCWDLIQRDFDCCGPNTYTDWFRRNTSLVNGTEMPLPSSCFCQDIKSHCLAEGAISYAHGFVFSRGCTKLVSWKLRGQLLSLVVIVPTSVALILIAFLNDVMYTLRTAQLVLQQQSGT